VLHKFSKVAQECNHVRCLRIVALNVLAIAVLFIMLNATETITKAHDSTVLVQLHLHRRCVSNKMLKLTSQQIWTSLNNITEDCSNASALESVLHVEAFANNDEVKYMLRPFHHENLTKFACTMVTLGIGNDVSAEQRVKARFPGCKFYGADPASKQNGPLFANVGQYYEMAVGAKRQSVVTNVWHYIGTTNDIKNVNMTHMDLRTFLTVHVGQQIVDQLTIDTEGGEFDLLRLLADPGSIDVSICQFNVEMHYSPTENSLRQILLTLLQTKKWVIIRCERHPSFGHLRIFFFNYGDSVCVQRYFGPHCSLHE